MAAITKKIVKIHTGDRPSAGTSGEVYVGIGGREFNLYSLGSDFRTGSKSNYMLGGPVDKGGGDERPVLHPAQNNPSADYLLDTDYLDRFPIYIRFEPKHRVDNWNLEEVERIVNSGADQRVYRALGGDNHLWLGKRYGKYCYLFSVDSRKGKQ